MSQQKHIKEDKRMRKTILVPLIIITIILFKWFWGDFFYIKKGYTIKNYSSLDKYLKEKHSKPINLENIFINNLYIIPSFAPDDKNYGEFSYGPPYKIYIITEDKLSKHKVDYSKLIIKNIKAIEFKLFGLGKNTIKTKQETIIEYDYKYIYNDIPYGAYGFSVISESYLPNYMLTDYILMEFDVELIENGKLYKKHMKFKIEKYFKFGINMPIRLYEILHAT